MRAETIVRDALRLHVLDTIGGASHTVEEMWVPRTHERADLAVIGRSMDGFEIKTDRDTLRRFPRQADAYARLFDRCTAVVADKHVDRVVEVLPGWWGVTAIALNQTVGFTELRKAGRNPLIDAETLVRLLWRDEALSALLSIGTKPNQSASRASLWEQLLHATTLEHLRTIVRRMLLRRDPARARIATRQITTRLAAAAAGQ
jgi:hypothetical protein